MNSRDVMQHNLKSSFDILNWFLSDLSDADLLVRPVPGANHIAWQLGHLINSEAQMISIIGGAGKTLLPADFAEKHSSKTSGSDTGFCTKTEYMKHFDTVRKATMTAAEKLSDGDLDKPTEGEVKKYAPTWGALLLLVATHTMMHGGQFSVVRRKLGKPVLF